MSMGLYQGLIGNGFCSALIEPNTNISWLCWPRYDSSFVFGSLLDTERGGQFQIKSLKPATTQQHYIPHTTALRTEFSSSEGRFEVLDFAPFSESMEECAYPRQLIRILRPLEGKPRFRWVCEPTYDYARTTITSSWFEAKNQIRFNGFPQYVTLDANIALSHASRQTDTMLEQDVVFVLTWSEQPFACTDIEAYALQQLNTTTEAWKKWVQSCRLPSKYQEEVIRSALTLKLHQYTPTGAFTAATTTSLPEDSGSERNWDYRFCWPRDSYFTATVFHRLGKLDEVGAYIDFLSRLLDTDVTNRFQPIYGIDGERDLTEYLLKHLSGYQNNPPVRIGNAAYDQVQNDLYGQLIMSIAPLCFEPTLQTADRPFPKVLLEELLCQIEQRLEQPDAGLWEFRTISQVHSYTLLTHWKGAQVTKQIAAHKQWKELEKKADQLEQQARTLLQQKCWNEEKGAYMSDYTQRHMDGSLYMLVHWDFHPQADPRNHRHLRSLEQALAGKHRLMFRYKHADDFEQPSKATFTICSFWYVEALAKLGYRDKAQKQFDFLISCANPHGLFSEDIDEESLELWGNFPQTYSHVGLINAAFALSASV